MRVLTVRQPWAWAIIHGGKDVENRSRNIAGDYRGPVAIHAALQASEQGMRDANVRAAWSDHGEGDPLGALVIGAVIGVVDLVDVHKAAPESRVGSPERWEAACCSSPWRLYDGIGVHLGLANPRALATPIPAKGRLGLWTPGIDLRRGILDGLRPSPVLILGADDASDDTQGDTGDATSDATEQGTVGFARSALRMTTHKGQVRGHHSDRLWSENSDGAQPAPPQPSVSRRADPGGGR